MKKTLSVTFAVPVALGIVPSPSGWQTAQPVRPPLQVKIALLTCQEVPEMVGIAWAIPPRIMAAAPGVLDILIPDPVDRAEINRLCYAAVELSQESCPLAVIEVLIAPTIRVKVRRPTQAVSPLARTHTDRPLVSEHHYVIFDIVVPFAVLLSRTQHEHPKREYD
jgi:hypothetical protein